MRVAIVLFCEPNFDLRSFAEACLRFSPQLCLKRPDAIFIEIGKCKALYREETFLARVEILLKRFELKATVAIGNSLLEALLMAKYRSLDHERLPTDCLLDCFDLY